MSSTYYSRNKEKVKEKNKARYHAKKAEINAKRRADYQADTDKQDEYKVRAAQWRKDNPGAHKELKRKWKQENPAKVRAATQARRHKQKKSTPPWAEPDSMNGLYTLARSINDVFKKLDSEYRVHVDHIIPLNGKTVSGLHCRSNLQILSAEDNLRKGSYYQS